MFGNELESELDDKPLFGRNWLEDDVSKNQTVEVQVQPKSIFLISKLWLDPLENEVNSAYGYKPYGFVTTEAEANKLVSESRLFSTKDCWALMGPTREFIYEEIKRL